MASLIEGLRKLEQGNILLVINNSKAILNNNIDLLKLITKKSSAGIIIAISQPYISLVRLLQKNNIRTDDLFFVDLISSTVSLRSEKTDNCLFINSPNSLTELGIAVEQLMTSFGKKEIFLVIDNLSAFLIYNSVDITEKFIHFLINKMRMNNVTGIIMSVDEDASKTLIDTISSFSDNIIKIN